MNESQTLMERAGRYLQSADLLLRDGDYESAVSRTYYAMFFAAQAVLLTQGLSFSSHKMVLSAFGEKFVKTNIFSRQMGRQLNLAFEKRQLGDYEYRFVISPDEAKDLLENGKQFAAEIEKYLRQNAKPE